MSSQFRFIQKHLLTFFQNYTLSRPLDFSLYLYMKQNKSLGSHDRKLFRERAIEIVRFENLLIYPDLPNTPETWIEQLEHLDRKRVDPSIPESVRLGMPAWFYDQILTEYGEDVGREILHASNQKGPLTIRINPLALDPDETLRQLRDKAEVVALETPLAYRVETPLQVQSLPCYQAGGFEVQDEGSQQICGLIDVAPGDRFLDFCSGSGGKALAVAPKMQGKGLIVLHDIRQKALEEAKRRLKRAKVTHAKVLPPSHQEWKRLKHAFDVVLVDAPCSGSGTLRRQAELRSKMTEEGIERFQKKQRTIFEKALSFVKPHGQIVYATCSVFAKENRDNVAYFLEKYPVEALGPPLCLIPRVNGPDGFFAQKFRRILVK